MQNGEAGPGQIALLRRTTRGIDPLACLHLAATPEGEEKSCLLHDDPGFLYFDGGSYSHSPAYIGVLRVPADIAVMSSVFISADTGVLR